MPRKINSSGVSTLDRNTSAKRAAGADKAHAGLDAVPRRLLLTAGNGLGPDERPLNIAKVRLSHGKSRLGAELRPGQPCGRRKSIIRITDDCARPPRRLLV